MTAHPKTILITGASSGIGAALALAYAAPGVILHLGGRDSGRLEAVAEECRGRGADVRTAQVPVTDRELMKSWIEDADSQSPLDLVIANAGISGGTGGTPGGESVANARALFDVNVTGVFNTVEPILPRMLSRHAGQVAIVSSLAAFRGWPGAPAYSASKAAVRVYGEALRGALHGTGVKINVVCPGFIATPMTRINDYPMPFMIDSVRCADIIRKGLAADRGRIAFPAPTYFLAWLFGVLPDSWVQGLLRRLPAKPRTTETA